MDVTLLRAPTREVVPWSRVRSIEPLGRGAVVICYEGGFPSRTERRIQPEWRLSAIAIAVALMAPPIAAQDPDPAEAWWSAYDDHPPGVYVLPVDSLLPFEAGGREEIETGLEAFDPADRPDRFHAPLPMEWAESLVPPAEMIEAAAAEERARSGAARRAQEEAARRPGDRWWWREWDDVWLPFALTGRAVDHYVTRVRELAAGPNPFGSSADHRASVDYHATIERVDDESAPDVAYEVRMEVDFDFYCGLLCALRFRHTRTVRFDADGEPIDIAGDSRPNYVVS